MSSGIQSGFVDALRDPALGAPAALAAARGGRTEKRFAVYRNNVVIGLVSALEARFPAVRRIVGEEFFAELARAYAAASPPDSPVMMSYGDGFATFCEALPALAEIDYLGDIARLEAARTRAYHAADREPLTAEAFAAAAADDPDSLLVTLHPSAEVVRSRHPVVTIWSMNSGAAEPAAIADWRAEDALVVRPCLEVEVRLLPPGGAAFLLALARGLPLSAAAAEAEADDEAFDLTQNLIGLMEAGLAVGLTPAAPEDRA